MKIIISIMFCIFSLSPSFGQRPHYGGGHHAEGHGGHYAGGYGDSKKGSHYVNTRTKNNYGIHKERKSSSSRSKRR
jgi:hypothetical protein